MLWMASAAHFVWQCYMFKIGSLQETGALVVVFMDFDFVDWAIFRVCIYLCGMVPVGL